MELTLESKLFLAKQFRVKTSLDDVTGPPGGPRPTKIRDGPLGKLWGEGWGIFELHECFFVNISLAGIFFPNAWTFFLGYLLCINFFHSIFPYMNFFCASLPPHNFSNGPSLTSSCSSLHRLSNKGTRLFKILQHNKDPREFSLTLPGYLVLR